MTRLSIVILLHRHLLIELNKERADNPTQGYQHGSIVGYLMSQTFLNDLYEFRMTQLENGLVEIHIIMPTSIQTPCNYKGAEARKRLTKFILSSASGLASTLRFNIEDKLGVIYETVAESVDVEQKMQLLLEKISTGSMTAQDLASNPPEGMDSHQVEVIIQYLLDNGDLILEDNLNLTWKEKSLS